MQINWLSTSVANSQILSPSSFSEIAAQYLCSIKLAANGGTWENRPKTFTSGLQDGLWSWSTALAKAECGSWVIGSQSKVLHLHHKGALENVDSMPNLRPTKPVTAGKEPNNLGLNL